METTLDHHLTPPEWIAIAAHRLHYRWRSINPVQLEDVAAELWKDEHLSSLEPARAVDAWLTPILPPPAPR
jgi:hypothetical protein